VFGDLQARVEQLRGVTLIPLHIGDTFRSPPAGVMNALSEALAQDGASGALFRYGATGGLPELREAVAARSARHGVRVEGEASVLIANGGTHALFCAARALLDEGDEVLVASPYWPLAPGIFTSCAARVVEVPLTSRLYDDPSCDAGALFAAHITPRTKAVYFSSPNNPDGKVLAPRDVASIAQVAREHDLWIFSDEVYADTVFDGSHVSIASLPGMQDRTIVVHSMSKSHALAGCRVGYVTAPPGVVALARRVSTHSAFNVSVLMQRAALAALEDAGFPVAACAEYRAARDAALRAFAGAPVEVRKAEGATYLFVDFAPAFDAMDPDRRGARPLLALLERAVDRGVLLAPGDAFGKGFETCARVCTTSVPAADVVTGIERVLAALDAMGRGEP
jgi:aspartate/methionine/tyrosine aminotransferase